MNEEIQKILDGILRYCSPSRVLLYGAKHIASSQRLKSVDICIILPETDKQELLHTLYLSINVDIPIHLLVYTCEEWESLQRDAASYAAMIAGRGTVLYEQES